MNSYEVGANLELTFVASLIDRNQNLLQIAAQLTHGSPGARSKGKS